MLDLSDLVKIVADSFTGGSTEVAGMMIFAMVIGLVFVFIRSAAASLIVSLPLAFMFNTMGIIPQDLMVLLIIIAVLGLAFTTRKVWSDD